MTAEHRRTILRMIHTCGWPNLFRHVPTSFPFSWAMLPCTLPDIVLDETPTSGYDEQGLRVLGGQVSETNPELSTRLHT